MNELSNHPVRRIGQWPRAALVAIAVAVLAGCQTPPQRPSLPVQSWEARRSELQQRDHFGLRGRVAVAAGQEGFNARMRWVQQAEKSEIALDGPLGVGGAQVSLDGEALAVRNSKGEGLSDAAARAELTARLGFDPPLRSLRFWIQGVPDPATPAQETLDAQQRLASLGQDGWQISYASYGSSGERMPERLTLQRDAVRVRLIIDSWEP